MEIIRKAEYMEVIDGRECKIIEDLYITDSGKRYNCRNVFPVHTPEEEERYQRELSRLKTQIIENIRKRKEAEKGG